jgi:membrane fusion protein (multidrug efflux system)
VLGFRQVSPGTLVTPGTAIATLDDIRTIKLDFPVPEAFLASVAPGLSIAAKSAAWPDREFEGKVRAVDSRVDPVTRAVTVRAEIPNPDSLLRPGMLLTVQLFKPERQALIVPEIALIQVGGQSYVFRVGADATVEQVEVGTGARRRGEVEIVAGLAAGDRIVVEGTVKLRPGAAIAEAPAAAPAATAAEP